MCAQGNAIEQRGYLIGKKIGKGSFGKVHLAHYNDGTSRKNVRLACKIVTKGNPKKFLDEKFHQRELHILTEIENPNIIHVHSILRRGPEIFIFMSFAEMGNLLDFIRKNGKVPEQQARIWFRQMASGLQYLHRKNIAHRDLKCQNILLSKHFNAKLADLGFARFCVDYDGRPVLSETYCGSLHYMAPEILRKTPYNPKIADVWSLGVILFFMLNASKPFDGSEARTLRKSHTRREVILHFHFPTSILAKSLLKQILETNVSLRPTIDRVLENEWVTSKNTII
jgi:serine kinase